MNKAIEKALDAYVNKNRENAAAIARHAPLREGPAFAERAALEAAIQAAVDEAVREERDAVCAWLHTNENTYWANRNYSGAADKIERGEHRKP